MSFGVNPFHVHEYTGGELERLLSAHFARVELRGVNASERVLAQWEARRRQVDRILRFDLLDLRHRLPRRAIEFAFGRLARLVRLRLRRRGELPPAGPEDFAVGRLEPRSLDLLALCGGPL
jgi:hypothetical protein